jgi:hypothetical protein
MFRTLKTALLLCSLLTLPLVAQTDRARDPRPNFSGTWVMDTRHSDSAQAPDATRITSATVVIAHNDREIRVESVRNGLRQVAVYPTADASHEPPRAVGTSGSVGSVVERDGRSMVTMTPHEVNGMAVTTTERWSLNPDGKTMTVVTTLTIQHGYEGPSGINYSSPITDIYTRQSK